MLQGIKVVYHKISVGPWDETFRLGMEIIYRYFGHAKSSLEGIQKNYKNGIT